MGSEAKINVYESLSQSIVGARWSRMQWVERLGSAVNRTLCLKNRRTEKIRLSFMRLSAHKLASLRNIFGLTKNDPHVLGAVLQWCVSVI